MQENTILFLALLQFLFICFCCIACIKLCTVFKFMSWIRRISTTRTSDERNSDQEHGEAKSPRPKPIPIICHNCSHPIMPATFSYAPQFYENQIQPRSPIPYMNAYYQMVPPPFFPAAMPKLNENLPKVIENPQKESPEKSSSEKLSE